MYIPYDGSPEALPLSQGNIYSKEAEVTVMIVNTKYYKYINIAFDKNTIRPLRRKQDCKYGFSNYSSVLSENNVEIDWYFCVL